MKFNKYCQIQKVAAKGQSRFAITGVNFDRSDKNNPILVATNGKTLAVVRCQEAEEDETEGIIPRVAIERSLKGKKNQPAHIMCYEDECVVQQPGEIAKYPREEEGKFPDWRSVVPKKSSADFSVSLNPKLLLELAQAIGISDQAEQSVILYYTFGERTCDTPVLVTLHTGANYGVIMPVTVK